MNPRLPVVLVAMLSGFPAVADEPPLLPDPTLTPGAVDPAATLSVVCNGTTRRRRAVSTTTKLAVAAAYGIEKEDVGVR